MKARDKKLLELIESQKICTQCHTPKPRSEFYRCKGGRDGLQSACKTCGRGNRDQRKLAHPEHITWHPGGTSAAWKPVTMHEKRKKQKEKRVPSRSRTRTQEN